MSKKATRFNKNSNDRYYGYSTKDAAYVTRLLVKAKHAMHRVSRDVKEIECLVREIDMITSDLNDQLAIRRLRHHEANDNS